MNDTLDTTKPISDTPETDGLYNPDNGWTGVCPIDHARKLERERNQVAAEAGRALAEIMDERDQLARIRDRYRQALQQIAYSDFRGNRSTESQIAFKALNP